MQNIAVGLDAIELSAITKVSVISKVVKDVTLGPHSKGVVCDDASYKSGRVYEVGKRNCLSLSPCVVRSRNMTSGSVRSIEREDHSSRSVMKLMYELDQQRQMKVKDSIQARFLKMEEDSRICQSLLNIKYDYIRCEIEAKVLHVEQQILHQLQEDEMLASQRQQELAQEHRERAQVRQKFYISPKCKKDVSCKMLI
jgi:hypothetical protein